MLAATFAALGVLPILFLAQIAFIVAFGVLLDTFLVRSLLVPALVVRHRPRRSGGRRSCGAAGSTRRPGRRGDPRWPSTTAAVEHREPVHRA